MFRFARNVAYLFGCVSCILFGAAAVQAQLLQGSIRVQAEAVNVSGALVWQVNMQFSPGDVVIDEATIPPQLKTSCPQISNTIRARILNELTNLGRSSFFIDSFTTNNYSLPDALQPQAFFSALNSKINRSNSTDRPLQFNQTPPLGFTAPTRAGETLAEHNWTRWQFELDVMVLAVTGDNKEMFGVSGLELIDDVQIKVTPAADATGNQTPNERDREIAELLNERYKPRLLAQPGQIPTTDILDKDTRQLYLVRNVSAVPKYTFADGVLTYEVERRREIVNLTLTGSGSYSPEYALNGSLTVTGDNLFHRSESLNIDFQFEMRMTWVDGKLQKGDAKPIAA